MKLIIFKAICFIAVFIFAQGKILPWAISNNTMPLWADITLITLVVIMWMTVLDRITLQVFKLIKKVDEITR